MTPLNNPAALPRERGDPHRPRLSWHRTRSRPGAPPARLSGIVVALALVLPASGTVAPLLAVPTGLQAGSIVAPPPEWRGPDGEPLPWSTAAEIEEFLRRADVVDEEVLVSGSTRPVRVILERDGVRARAIFRHVDEEHRRVRMGPGDFRMHLRDYHGFEVAAYRVDRLLGLGMVPPAVDRTLHRRSGSLQLWMEATITEKERLERRARPDSAGRWVHQLHAMRVFDYLIANDDRHAANILVDPESWRLWLVDHTRTFQRRWQGTEELLGRIAQCEAGLWERLRSLDPETVRRHLGDQLPGREVDALLDRKERLLGHLRALIDSRGHGAVICPAERPSGPFEEPRG